MKRSPRSPQMALFYEGTDELHLAFGDCFKLPDRRLSMFGFVSQGQAQATLEHGEQRQAVKILPGQLFYLADDIRCTLENVDETLFHVIWILFDWEWHYEQPTRLFPGNQQLQWICFRAPQARAWVQEFVGTQSDQEAAQYYQLQSYLYALVALCLQQEQTQEPSGDEMIDYVERTKQYMQDHYWQTMDIEEVARQSGSAPSRFYETFRKMTGLSPHKYMTTLRLKGSLQQLAQAKSSVTDAAHAVGYADELYFSRVFKKQMGLTPTEYAIRTQKRIVVPSIFVGDLIVLGMVPLYVLKRGWDEAPAPYLEQIRQQQPAFILTSPIADELRDELTLTAPTYRLKWKGSDWKERLLTIGSLLGVQSVAEWWLALYEQKVQNARLHVKRRLGDTPFVLVSVFALDQFRVYGVQMKKIKNLFYDDLGVAIPPAMREEGLLDNQSLQDVAAIDCNHVLFLAPDFITPQQCAWLEQQWRAAKGDLPQLRCLFVRHTSPLYYNADMYDKLVDTFLHVLLKQEEHR